jgi:hypothetical protein
MKHHALNALFDAFADVVVPNSCDVVVIDGELDRERLREAIATTVARHPVLCHPLAGGEGTPPIDLRFHVLEDDEPASVDRHLLGLIWDEPLAPRGRPVRFHVTLTPTRSYFQTIHTHVYADASACYLLTMQIAESYAQPHARVAGDPAHVAPAALLASAGSPRERFLHHVRGLLQTLRDWRAVPAGLAVRAGAPVGQRKLTRLTLTEDQTKRLRAAARARGHSMHAFFQLAFLRAATEYNRRRGVLRPTLRMWDFFSLRPLLDRDSTRYDCLALIYPVMLDARWSDDECLTRCSETVKRMRAGELLTHAARFESLRRIVPRRRFMRVWPALFKSNVFFTNPGVCPSPLRRFGELDVVDYVTFPQLFDPSDVQFIFSTFRERLRILVIHDEAAFGTSLRSELLSAFFRRIAGLGEVDLEPDAGCEGFVARWQATAT